jgi:hypothetical protein
MSSPTLASGLAAPVLAADQLSSRFKSLAQLAHPELTREVHRLVAIELDLPEDARRRRIIRRFQAWLELKGNDLARVADVFHQAVTTLSTDDQELIEDAERNALLDGLSYADFRRLADSISYIRQWWPELQAQEVSATKPSSLAMALALLSGVA